MERKYLTKKEVESVVDYAVKTRLEQMGEAIEKKFAENVKERVYNDIERSNKYIQEQLPESGVISFVLPKSELQFPINDNTKLVISFYVRDKMVGEKEYNSVDLSDDYLQSIQREIKEVESVVIKTSTTMEVELYDEKLFNEKGITEKIKKNYVKSFSSYLNSTDVSAIYRASGKFE